MAQWNRNNHPDLMGFKYERDFSKLPLKGDLKTTPWSGDYWPTYKGGITYRWNQKGVAKDIERWSYDLEDIADIKTPLKDLSPAEKFDLFLGHEGFPLTTYERERTKIFKTIETHETYDKSFEIPTWEGLCHAWAPATIHYGEPESVTVTGAKGHKITFGSSDIKALLTYHLHLNKGIKTKGLGSRCYLDFAELRKKHEDGEITKEELDAKINSDACADTNAGAFHVVLTNQISFKDESFIVDVTRDAEVWNQPVTGYTTEVYKTTEGASEGAAPGTVKEVWVKTGLKYIIEVTQSFELIPTPWKIKYAYYDYRLELNKEGRIIGGEWISETRPDFLWKNKASRFKGYFAKLKDIYEKSVAYLNPSKYTEELKAKVKKLGKKELLKKDFIQKMKLSSAKTRALKSLKKDFLNGKAIEELKASGVRTKNKRISKRVAILKKEANGLFLTKKFIKGSKELVRDANINRAKETFKKDHKTNFLGAKFIEGSKEIVRDAHIRKAKTAFKKDHKKKYLSGKFAKELSADAKETRRIKEEHKAKALKTLISSAKNSFLSKKFVSEVSKDAKATRVIKEAKKAKAKASLKKKMTKDFNASKFISVTSIDAKETRRVKEEHKAQAKKEVMSSAKTSFLTKKFITAVKTDAQITRENKAKVISAVKNRDLKSLRGLVNSGVSLDFVDLESGLTPLMIAAKENQLATVNVLISGLDKKGLNAADKDGKNALIWAIVGPGEKPNKKTRKVAKILVKAGVDVKAEDSQGMSALDFVSTQKYKSRRIAMLLKSKGA
jgi:hypothetical protein